MAKTAVILWVLLAACMPVPRADVAPARPEFCAKAKPLYIARGDRLTPATASAIVAHNETGEKLCGWKRP